jgi:signal transduction histidine kinase
MDQHLGVPVGASATEPSPAGQELADTLRRMPFLAHLGDAVLLELAAAGVRMRVPAGAVLFEQGAVADEWFVLLSGRVHILRRLDDRREPLRLSEVGAGEFFGEVALLDGGVRSASAVAVDASELFVLKRESFLWLLAVSPDLIQEVFRNLTGQIRDTTERLYRDEIEAHKLQADLERERHRALAQLVAGVAHEINTPIGIANTAASLIARGVASPALARAATDPDAKVELEDIAEAVRLLESNVARASRLIQSFKSLSVAEASEQIESHSLPQVVAEAVDLFSPNARRARLDVRVVAEGLPAEAHAWTGRRGHLTQVLLNLLTNVERYAYPDGAGGVVEIRLTLEAGSVSVSVRDSGRGIAPDDLPRVFDPFFTTGRGRGGSGLGMAIVRNLVTAGLGGNVGIESELGVGTVVTVTLPRAH